MSWFYVLVAVVVAMMVIVVVLEKLGLIGSGKERHHLSGLPYQKKNYLLTLAERPFFDVLQRIAQRHNAYVFIKVRLEDLVFVAKGTMERWGYRNKIKSRHVDFVICDHKDVRPLIAIELNDSSHLQKRRMVRDHFYEQLFGTIGLPFLQVPAHSAYDEQELENQIKALIDGSLPS